MASLLLPWTYVGHLALLLLLTPEQAFCRAAGAAQQIKPSGLEQGGNQVAHSETAEVLSTGKEQNPLAHSLAAGGFTSGSTSEDQTDPTGGDLQAWAGQEEGDVNQGKCRPWRDALLAEML